MQPIIPRIVPLDSAEDGISILIHFSVFLDPPGLLSRYSIRSLENREAIELFLAICLSIPFSRMSFPCFCSNAKSDLFNICS